MESMLRRLKHLEELQEVSVESTLQDIRSLLKSPAFSKDQAFDYLLTLQLVAKEKKHAKAGYYEAILRAMRDKSSVDIDQFKRYLEVLIGDKDQEKVLDLISKVDKAAKRKSSFSESSAAPKRGLDGLGFSVFTALVMAITRAIAHKSFQEEGMAEDAGRLNEETEKLMNF